MKGSVGRFAGRAVRVIALVALLLAIVPAAHVHTDRLDSPSACASCALAQTRSAGTTIAPVLLLVLLVVWVAAQPRLLLRRRVANRPFGRAPPPVAQLVI